MGSATDINTAMIAMTIISSMSVKPKRRRLRTGSLTVAAWQTVSVTASPCGISCSIARLVHALGVHVEYVLAAPGLRSGIVAVATQTPFVRVGHGVLGDAAQIFHFLVHRPRSFDSVHQLLQAFRIVVRIQLGRADLLGVHIVLELVDRISD